MTTLAPLHSLIEKWLVTDDGCDSEGRHAQAAKFECADELSAALRLIGEGVEARKAGGVGTVAFQKRVCDWMLACFGELIASDKIERNHRFLEEALELIQACGCTASEAHQLVDYTFGRPVGEKSQECGGVLVTLAALCSAQGINMDTAGEKELARIWTKVDVIRAKQAAKPKYSPLPVCGPSQAGVESGADAKDAQWTLTKPTAEGWYWMNDRGAAMQVVHVFKRHGHDYLCIYGEPYNGRRSFEPIAKLPYQWCGPIPKPIYPLANAAIDAAMSTDQGEGK